MVIHFEKILQRAYRLSLLGDRLAGIDDGGIDVILYEPRGYRFFFLCNHSIQKRTDFVFIAFQRMGTIPFVFQNPLIYFCLKSNVQ